MNKILKTMVVVTVITIVLSIMNTQGSLTNLIYNQKEYKKLLQVKSIAIKKDGTNVLINMSSISESSSSSK